MSETQASSSFSPIQFDVNGNLGYEFGLVDEWTEAAQEYIDLLQGELERSMGFLHVHGWTVPDEKVQRGKELRAILGIKGTGE